MPKMVTYNGVKMRADWPPKIEAAQSITHYTIGGKSYQRVCFGAENPEWGSRPCRDCGVLKGQLHVPDCEYESCPACKEPFAGGCDCDVEELRPKGEPQVDIDEVKRTARRNFKIFMALVSLLLFLLAGLIAWSLIVKP